VGRSHRQSQEPSQPSAQWFISCSRKILFFSDGISNLFITVLKESLLNVSLDLASMVHTAAPVMVKAKMLRIIRISPIFISSRLYNA
jgi:hypothetical protein